MSIPDEEHIIKRRLQIDGEGVGDDRRINLLLKTFIKWCHEDTVEDISMPLATQLALSEFAIQKSELSEQMIDAELKNYKKVSDVIAEKIDRVKDEIEESKKHLVTAKEIRRNKLEYSSLARFIKEQPDRKEIIKKHEDLKAELVKQNEEYQKINKALENKRKDFACFMLIANELFRDAEKNDSEETGEETMGDDTEEDDEDNIESMIIE
ncbi:THO complex subunit 7 homolog [Chironomus tepperi]|uniref:THO complex subunit 7 homolog n=1 Tax=Chironomus tepperi TaxID=113505 RepID=UPI00391F8B65